MAALTSWLVAATGPGSTAPDGAAWQDMQVHEDSVVTGGAVSLQSGRTVRLGPTRGWCGGFPFKNPANLDIVSAANANANNLIDRLVVRLTWGVGISLEILRGVASAAPTLPALTQVYGGTWEIPIAYWVVLGSNGNNTGLVVEYDGAWRDLDLINGWGGFESTPQWTKVGNVIRLRGQQAKSGAVANGDVIGQMRGAARPSRIQHLNAVVYIPGSDGTSLDSHIRLNTDGTMQLIGAPSSFTAVSFDGVSYQLT